VDRPLRLKCLTIGRGQRQALLVSAAASPIRVCFVCLGNICRSPTAEGVMKKLVRDAGLDSQVLIESAGTGSYHVGEPADRRSAAEARKRGIELDGTARQFTVSDFDRFDYVIAMDRRNHGFLKRSARGPADLAKLSLLRAFDPQATGQENGEDVPDPYFEDNFGVVFDICHAGCSGLLAHIIRERALQ
jgi:protein-tyrosine phosphatase